MKAAPIIAPLLLAGLVAAAPTAPGPAVPAKRQCSAPSQSTAPPPTSSAPPATSTPPASGGGGGAAKLPKHALFGYLHSSFMNGAGYIKMADVSNDWDVINLSFGQPDTATSGNIAFSLCPATDCPTAESEADFIKAIDAKVAAGKIVQLSIGGEFGQVSLTTEAARDKFVQTVSGLMDKFHLTGLDIDFEGQSIHLDTGDTDFQNPKTNVIVNLISAIKTLKQKYPNFTLTMAPETFFVQLAVQFYGSGVWGGQDPRAGSFIPIIHALRDDLTTLHVQDYNSGPITGTDGNSYTMGGIDFHVAMTDALLTGFKVGGVNGTMFPALRPDQVGFGVPSDTGAGNGYVDPSIIQNAVSCIVKGTNCGAYKPKAQYPNFRGVMSWSINWDNYGGNTFSKPMRSFFNSLS